MTAPTPNADDLKRTSPRQSSPKTGLRRLLPFNVSRKKNSWQVQVFWKQLVVSAVLFIVLGWLAAASAAYLFVKYRRGFTEVKFSHMLLLPAKWDEYEIARGEFLIRNAQKDMQEERYREAFYGLRLGLIKAPNNKEARLLLAQFYGLWKRPDLTRLTLIEGMAHHSNDDDYLKIFFSFLLEQQEDKEILAHYKELLGNDPSINKRNQLIAFAAASACYYRGNYDEAETILRRYRLGLTRDGRLLQVRIDWDRGARDQALTRLSELAVEFPKDEEIYAQTVTYLREAGRDAEARRESFMRALGNPRNARARIDQLYALHKEGDTAAVKRNSEEIFSDFLDDSDAMVALADFAANSGDPVLARRVYDHAKARNLNWEGPALMTVEANIVAKEYQSALEVVRELLKANPEWGKRFYSVFNGLQAIANYGLGDAEAAQLFLNNYLSQSSIRTENLIAVSKRLLDVGARSQARQVLEQAVKNDALNQAALTNLIQLDLDLNNTAPLAANVRKLLTMRRPSREVLQSAYRKLGSDLFIFSPDRTALLADLRAAIGAPSTNS